MHGLKKMHFSKVLHAYKPNQTQKTPHKHV